ncbi:MAG: thioredoxin-dependent thiol peroxidase [Phascolarctobacterium sp.]|nr:thioredoxin-dependent thiol peroxidase [Phascolarctobacterium sp.]
MLAVGTKAPGFTLPDKDGNMVSLADFAGKKVVLYFYPKDSTPGCTRQAQAFRDAFDKFVAEGAVIIGISKDSVKSHLNFATKQELPFILLSDTELTTLQAYEVWQEKKLYGKISMGVVRSVYVIDEAGMIAAAWTKVKPEQSVTDALEFVCSCNK